MVVRKFNVVDVTMRPIGGSQSERFQALAGSIVQGVVITPPLDVGAKNEGYSITCRLIVFVSPCLCPDFSSERR